MPDLTDVVPLGLEGVVDLVVVVLEDGDGPGDADPGVADVVLEEVGPEQLLVGVHPDRDDLVDDLRARVVVNSSYE